MRSTVATDRRGCFSVAPSVARARGRVAGAWGAGCRGTEDRPCSAGARGNAGVASSRRCAVSGYFIGRGVRGARNSRRLPARWRSRCGGFGAWVRCFGWLHRALWVEVRGTHVGGRCRGAHGGRLRVTSSGAGRGARDSRRRPARWRSRCGGFGAGVRRFGRLHRPLWGELRGTHVGYLRGGFTVRRLRGAGAVLRVTSSAAGGGVRGIHADCLRGGAHGVAGVGEEAGVSLSQKRSRSNRSASASSPPASARARAWSTS